MNNRYRYIKYVNDNTGDWYVYKMDRTAKLGWCLHKNVDGANTIGHDDIGIRVEDCELNCSDKEYNLKWIGWTQTTLTKEEAFLEMI